MLRFLQILRLGSLFKTKFIGGFYENVRKNLCQLYYGGSWPDFFNNTGYINLGINGLALPQKSLLLMDLLLKEKPSSPHALEPGTQVRGIQPGCRDGLQLFLFIICTDCAAIFQINEHVI